MDSGSHNKGLEKEIIFFIILIVQFCGQLQWNNFFPKNIKININFYAKLYVPSQGYSTIGLKPDILTRLQNITNVYYPGMFLPSTLIILMNEVKRGYYSVNLHSLRLDLSGRYNSITIRLDVSDWLRENYKEMSEDYEKKYNVKGFSRFTSYFLANLFESKLDSQNHVIRLKEADFGWLQEEYAKFKANNKGKYPVPTFEKFADVYLNELSNKIKAAREILTLSNISSNLDFTNKKN